MTDGNVWEVNTSPIEVQVRDPNVSPYELSRFNLFRKPGNNSNGNSRKNRKVARTEVAKTERVVKTDAKKANIVVWQRFLSTQPRKISSRNGTIVIHH